MIITPISTGPFWNLKHRGSGDAQKRAIYEKFSGKSMSVLLAHNYLFFLTSHQQKVRHENTRKRTF
ncbi:hypothetical protein C3441_02040 [Escherichia coli]|nr:hypothetical protein C3441_02040 [Escherichia coli]